MSTPEGMEQAPVEIPTERRARLAKRRRGRRDVVGSVVGLLVFLGGVALLLLVFKLAYSLFETPPTLALRIQDGKAVDLASASDRLYGIVVKVVLLILMALTGSLVANRGILLYARSVGRKV